MKIPPVRSWRKLVLAALLGLLLALGWRSFVSRDSGVGQPPAAAIAARPAPAAIAPLPPVAPDSTRTPTIRPASLRRFTYANQWDRPADRDLAAFRDWVNAYLAAADPAERARLEVAGVALARARRTALRALIARDPQAALGATIPADLRRLLPAAIVAELEQRFSTRGHYTVTAVDYPVTELIRRKQQGVSTEIFERRVELAGAEYPAFVYGRRTGQTTKQGLPLHGILLDGVVALHDAPLRLLEPGESAAVGEFAVEIGGRILSLASADEVPRAAARLAALERGLGPQLQGTPADPVTGLSAAPEYEAPVADAPATAWTIGNKKVLVIRVDFSDLPGEPRRGSTIYTQSYVQNLADTQIAPYYVQSSYGLTTLTHTVSASVFRLPKTSVEYATTAAGNTNLHTDARAAAAAQYTLSDYDRIEVLFSTLSGISGSLIVYGGRAQVGGANVWVNGYYDFRVVAHELGHTYGLFHGNLWQVADGNALSASGSSTEYGDDYDTMGANYANDRRTDFNPWFKNLLGWVTDAQVQTVATDGTYRVNRFDHPSATGPLALKITRDGTRNYWVGVRRNFTTNAALQEGAYVIWGYNSNQVSNLLDLNTPGSGVGDAALALGGTLLDTVGNLSIRPVAAGTTAPSEYLDVQVTFGLNGLPVIASPPASQGFSLGATVTLSVSATGSAPLAYQWRKNGTPLSGATLATLTLVNAQAGDAGNYQVTVSNAVGSVTSAAAALTLNAVPVIVSAPVSLMTAVGRTATFSVGASASPAPTYQWRTAGVPIAGAVAATYTIASVQLSDDGQYDVVVANALGAVTSGTVFLSVRPGGSPPSNDGFEGAWALSEGVGSVAGTNAGATGQTGEPTHVNTNGTATSVWYRWTPPYGGTAVVDTVGSSFDTVLSVYTGAALASLIKVGEDDQGGGLNTSRLVFPVVAGGTYYLAVGDAASTRLGGTIALRYAAYRAPVITTQPVSQVATLGGSATFTVVSSGTLPAFQWYRNGVVLPDATQASLALSPLQTSDAGTYQVVITNVAGSVSSEVVTLSGPNAAPVLVTAPVDTTVVAGQPATLAVNATGVAPLLYQWRRNGLPLAGATQASLVFPATSRTDADTYDVLVFSGLTATTSPAVRLAVDPAAYPTLVAPDPDWELRPEAVGGTGYAIVPLADGRAYLAGSFVSIDGVRRAGLARIDGAGLLDTTFAPSEIDGTVRALAVQADGRVILGGEFVRINGQLRNRIARLNTDGSVDPTFNVGLGADGTVMALALQADGRVVVGGNFTGFAGTARDFLVRLNPDGSVDTGFLTNGMTSTVNALALQADGRILVGGAFTVGYLDANGVSTARSRLARLNADGTLDSAYNPAPNNTVNALALQADGRCVLGGAFTAVGATAVGRLARIETSGAVDAAFTAAHGTGVSSTGASVLTLAVQADGKILAGGTFSAFNAATASNFVRLTATGARDSIYLSNGFSSTVSSVAVLPTGRILVGGGFSNYLNAASAATARLRFARVNTDGTLDTAVNYAVRTPGTINALVPLPGGKLIVTGFFTYLRGTATPTGVARINPDGSVDPTYNPAGTGANSNVYAAIAQPDGRVIITGFFSTYNGSTANGLARLNTDGTLDGTFNPGAGLGGNPGYTLSLLPGGRILVAGTFVSAGGLARNRVAVFQSNGTVDAAFDPGAGANSSVYASAVQFDGRIVLGGAFSTYGTTSISRVARLLPNGNIDPTFNPGTGPNASVYAVAVGRDGKLTLGGAFTAINGTGREGVGRLLADGTLDTAFAPPAVSNVFSLVLQGNGRTIVRGSFSAAGTEPGTAFLARLNPDGSRDTTFAAGGFTSSTALPSVLALGDAGQIYMPSNGSTGLSVAEATTLPIISAPPVGGNVAAGGSLVLSVTAGGALPVTYQWRRDGSPVAGATNATLPLANVQLAQAGTYTVVVTSELGSTTSAGAVVNLIIPAGLQSGTVWSESAAGGVAITGAFTVEGSTPKAMLVRAVGPTLGTFGVVGFLADPRLEIIHATTGAVVASNDNWGAAANAAQVSTASLLAGAFALSAGSQDAAILGTFAPGSYRVRVSGATAVSGIVLLEIYSADASPRLVHLATRGFVGSGGNAFVPGLVVAVPPTGRSYLIRALGLPAATGAVTLDPVLTLLANNVTLASNDNWGGNSTLSALATSAGAMPLPNASRDAVVSFVPPAAGAYTAQVTGAAGSSGPVLLEVFEVDAQRAPTLAPAIVVPPEPVAVTIGQPVVLSVVTVGKPTPALQWRKNGVAIAGATAASYSLALAQGADAGSYDVVASSSGGSVTSSAASVTVSSAGTDVATHAVTTGGYVAGGTVTISNTLTVSDGVVSLAWSATIPAGWSFAGDSGGAGDVKPAVGATGTLEWAWTSLPPNPVTFSYTLNVPATETVDRTLTALAIVRRTATGAQSVAAAPGLLVLSPLTYHSADTDRNGRISLIELTRVIELYNTRNGTSRTGAYSVATSASEDGFAPDSTRAGATVVTLARYHAADSSRDGRLSLIELTRVIELYNYRSGTSRTGQYHPQSGTEDGFSPGP